MVCSVKPFSATKHAQCTPRRIVTCAAHNDRTVGTTLAAGVVAAALLVAPAQADFRLPPIDKVIIKGLVPQANAVSDKVLDLRGCKYSGANLKSIVLSGALMSDADFSGANMQEVVLSKAYAVGAKLEKADLSNAVVDRTDFTNANLKGVVFNNAVITGVTFEGADLTGADFEDALIGFEDAKRLCNNPTVRGETRMGVGCRSAK